MFCAPSQWPKCSFLSSHRHASMLCSSISHGTSQKWRSREMYLAAARAATPKSRLPLPSVLEQQEQRCREYRRRYHTLLGSTSGTASSSEPKLAIVLLCGSAFSVMMSLSIAREGFSKYLTQRRKNVQRSSLLFCRNFFDRGSDEEEFLSTPPLP